MTPPAIGTMRCALLWVAHAAQMRGELAEGAQVFENYGWSNFDYAVAHGFMLPFGACPKDCLIARPRPLLRTVSYE